MSYSFNSALHQLLKVIADPMGSGLNHTRLLTLPSTWGASHKSSLSPVLLTGYKLGFSQCPREAHRTPRNICLHLPVYYKGWYKGYKWQPDIRYTGQGLEGSRVQELLSPQNWDEPPTPAPGWVHQPRSLSNLVVQEILQSLICSH